MHRTTFSKVFLFDTVMFDSLPNYIEKDRGSPRDVY